VKARFPQESAWERWLKRTTLAFVACYLVIATISGFRAIVQIYSVRIAAPSLLQPGTAVSTVVRSSGRTFGEVSLELAQRGRVDTLGQGTLAANTNSVFDPRGSRSKSSNRSTPPIPDRSTMFLVGFDKTFTQNARRLRNPFRSGMIEQ
jgi:hypothetical protein